MARQSGDQEFGTFSNDNNRRLNPQAEEFVPRDHRHQQQHQNNRRYRGRGGFSRGLGRENFRQNENFREIGSGNNDNLRTSIIERLRNETYECMICYDRIRTSHPVWSCQNCYSVFHFRCTKKWVNSCTGMQQNEAAASNSASEWRCPGCQGTNESVPTEYTCFCGKTKYPQRNHSMPHSCGELCKKTKSGQGNGDCPHPCNLLCHPGPCEICALTVDKKCLCGKESKRVRCGSEDFQCGQICGKLLNCSIHQCQRVCHAGDCGPCTERFIQSCYCNASERPISCGNMLIVKGSRYSCGTVCDKLHECMVHHCNRKCHEGGCGKCPFDIELVRTCCCGKQDIDDLSIIRTSCEDPVPVCVDVCGKILACGEEGNRHSCQSKCHSGECPVCPIHTRVRCRCGATTKSIACAELARYDADNPLLCDRRCSKKRTCKQHKCGELCCVDAEHLCTLICGKKLPCGNHTCDALCHGGRCRNCLQASFDELTCFCGASVIYPPVRCGTKPPACDRLCTRQHACRHPVTHNCHSEPTCPPCTYLTEKRCYGKHEMRKNVPCYLNDVSCGRACSLPMPCDQHSCTRTCHPAPCYSDGEQCNQPCVRPRASCGHPCASKCHGDSACPEDKLCEAMVKVTCKCGHEMGTVTCFEIDRLAAQKFMAKAAKADAKNDVNLDELERQESLERYKCLDCTDECVRVERNRRFVEALDIKTDDLVGDHGPPAYPDFLKDQFKLTPDVVFSIEKAFTELVSSADKSKQPTRSHVFPPMNRNHRRIIHEYAAYFDLDTVAYDQEPKRNVVVTAKKGKSKIPSILLSTVMQKENAKLSGRVMPPKANQTDVESSPANMKTLQSAHGTVFRRW